jgi:hypothetical protein
LDEVAEAIRETFSRAGESKHLSADQPMGRAWSEMKEGGVISSSEEVTKLIQGTTLCLRYIHDKPLRNLVSANSSPQPHTQKPALESQPERGNKRPLSTSPNRPAKSQSHSEEPAADPSQEGIPSEAPLGLNTKGTLLGQIEVGKWDPFDDERFEYAENPLHPLVGLQVGSRGLLPPVKFRLYPISGFQGSGSADMSFVVALQFYIPIINSSWQRVWPSRFYRKQPLNTRNWVYL